jgi:hypothetical protein
MRDRHQSCNPFVTNCQIGFGNWEFNDSASSPESPFPQFLQLNGFGYLSGNNGVDGSCVNDKFTLHFQIVVCGVRDCCMHVHVAHFNHTDMKAMSEYKTSDC